MPDPSPRLRQATLSDIPELTRVINLAYHAEAFCLVGDRTHGQDLAELMSAGEFQVLEAPTQPGRILGAVYLKTEGDRGYLGLLAVDPGFQGRGFARHLTERVEIRCREAGCRFLDLTVVNVRTDLFPFYTGLGYAAFGTLPFPRPEKMRQPIHLIQFTKPLLALAEL